VWRLTIEYSNHKMNKIKDLEIKGKLKPRFEFGLKPTKLKEWLKNFEFKFTINW
jgi:hypothetical protein